MPFPLSKQQIELFETELRQNDNVSNNKCTICHRVEGPTSSEFNFKNDKIKSNQERKKNIVEEISIITWMTKQANRKWCDVEKSMEKTTLRWVDGNLCVCVCAKYCRSDEKFQCYNRWEKSHYESNITCAPNYCRTKEKTVNFHSTQYDGKYYQKWRRRYHCQWSDLC